MGVQLETGNSCGYTSTVLGLRVVIANAGNGPASPFVVEVNTTERVSAQGLGAGQEVSFWFSSFCHAGENTATVDTSGLVAESDETNNTLTHFVPVPTLPPTCTPTPASSPTPTPNPIPPSVTPTPSPSPTPVLPSQR
jgi:hypothetical protein